jgi:hypothetical protein
MKSKNASMFLCRALVFSIAVLMTGFLGLGLRVFAAAETTKSILFVTFAISVAILVLYLMLRGPTRELTAHSPDRNLLFVKPSLFPRLSTISANIGPPGQETHGPPEPIGPGRVAGQSRQLEATFSYLANTKLLAQPTQLEE